MDRTVITKRINRLAFDIEKLKSTLAAIENTDIARYPENYNMLATDAALRSELIACRLRRLVFQSTDTKKPEYLASAGVVQGIDIREENGILKITLPCLLPKRKKRESTEFITDPLYFTLSRYSDGNPLKRYSHCVVCFSHIYSDDSRRYIRDYDNLELKQILDTSKDYKDIYFVTAEDSIPEDSDSAKFIGMHLSSMLLGIALGARWQECYATQNALWLIGISFDSDAKSDVLKETDRSN